MAILLIPVYKILLLDIAVTETVLAGLKVVVLGIVAWKRNKM